MNNKNYTSDKVVVGGMPATDETDRTKTMSFSTLDSLSFWNRLSLALSIIWTHLAYLIRARQRIHDYTEQQQLLLTSS